LPISTGEHDILKTNYLILIRTWRTSNCSLLIDPKRMKGWVDLVGWPVADRLPTWSPVSCRSSAWTVKVRRKSVKDRHSTNCAITQPGSKQFVSMT